MDQALEDVKNPQKGKRDAIKYFHENILHLNFYRVHMAYFIVVIAISSVIVYGEGLANANHEIHGTKLRYIDALFLCASAMTTTGLNTVNLGALTAFQQAVLFILMSIGNVIFVSMFSVIVRLYFFRQKLSDIVEHSKAGRKIMDDIERQKSRDSAGKSDDASGGDQMTSARLHTGEGEPNSGLKKRMNGSSVPEPQHRQGHRGNSPPSPYSSHHTTGFGSLPWPWEIQHVRNTMSYPFRKTEDKKRPPKHSYLSFEPQFDQRGRITGMNEDERAEIGGIEYRALKALIWVLLFYQLFWICFAVVLLVPYAYRGSIKAIITQTQPGDLNPGWWAYFAGQSSFANCGLNLLDANYEPFKSYYYVLIISMLLTATKETWELFGIQLAIDLIAWILFEILNLGVPSVMAIPPRPRVMDGLFQAVGLRTSGSYIITISDLAPGVLVAYLVAMYISSFPLVMALRQTNSYEEKSVGLDEGEAGGGLGSHIRRQLAYDIWFQIFAWFIIAIIQRSQIETSQGGFSAFSLLFEVTSAYGTVGLSTGVPDEDYSLSGRFYTLSKLVIMAVMIRGRHRGLPYAIDRAVLVPGEKIMQHMDEQYNKTGHFSKRDEQKLQESEGKSGEVLNKDGEGKSEQDPEDDEEVGQDQDADHGHASNEDSGGKDNHGSNESNDRNYRGDSHNNRHS